MAFFEFILLCCLAYAGILLFMFLKQDSLLFFATKTHHRPEYSNKLKPYSLIRKNQSKEIHLRGWLVNPKQIKERLIVYYGGNAEDIFENINEFEDVQASTLLMNYRGYGNSDGHPGEIELYSDALAIFDDIEEKFHPREIFLMGRSLGSGVATYVASRKNVNGVILITPYDSIVHIASRRYPWLPIPLLLKHKFESFRSAEKIRAPTLVIYGGADTTVPPDYTEILLKHFSSPVYKVFIDKAEHGTIEMHQEYWPAILHFIFEGKPADGAENDQ